MSRVMFRLASVARVLAAVKLVYATIKGSLSHRRNFSLVTFGELRKGFWICWSFFLLVLKCCYYSRVLVVLVHLNGILWCSLLESYIWAAAIVPKRTVARNTQNVWETSFLITSRKWVFLLISSMVSGFGLWFQ